VSVSVCLSVCPSVCLCMTLAYCEVLNAEGGSLWFWCESRRDQHTLIAAAQPASAMTISIKFARV